MKLDDIFPEREPVRNGDPFIARLSELDDFIIDHKYNAQLLGIEDWAAAATSDVAGRGTRQVPDCDVE